jgi:hypothetical protein
MTRRSQTRAVSGDAGLLIARQTPAPAGIAVPASRSGPHSDARRAGT